MGLDDISPLSSAPPICGENPEPAHATLCVVTSGVRRWHSSGGARCGICQSHRVRKRPEALLQAPVEGYRHLSGRAHVGRAHHSGRTVPRELKERPATAAAAAGAAAKATAAAAAPVQPTERTDAREPQEASHEDDAEHRRQAHVEARSQREERDRRWHADGCGATCHGERAPLDELSPLHRNRIDSPTQYGPRARQARTEEKYCAEGRPLWQG